MLLLGGILPGIFRKFKERKGKAMGRFMDVFPCYVICYDFIVGGILKVDLFYFGCPSPSPFPVKAEAPLEAFISNRT